MLICPACEADKRETGKVVRIGPSIPVFACLECGYVWMPEIVRTEIKNHINSQIIVSKPSSTPTLKLVK